MGCLRISSEREPVGEVGHSSTQSLLKKMKVCFIGTGALGGYYAACLARAGEEVHCLCRSDHDTVARKGLHVKSCEGDFNAKVHAHRTAEAIGVSDLVIVGVKTTSNEAVPPLLKPVVGTDTILLTLQNGLG